MVLINHLNYDVCDMINKVAMKNHKRQKIIDDYENVINNNDRNDNDRFYNIEILIQYKTQYIGREQIVIVNLDKDDAYITFQIINDYASAIIDNEIVGIYMFMISSFIDRDGNFCMGFDDNWDLIKYYEIPNYQELYDEENDWYEKENDEEFDEKYFLENYNHIKDLYDNDELQFYDNDDILIEISRYKSVGFFYSIKKDTHIFLKDLQYFTK